MDQALPADGLGGIGTIHPGFPGGLVLHWPGEKGLLVITLYFMVSNFSGMGCSTLQLPFFKNNAAPVRRLAGGGGDAVHHRVQLLGGGAVYWRADPLQGAFSPPRGSLPSP